MAFIKTYSPTELYGNATTAAEAVTNLYTFLTTHEEFDCLDIKKYSGSNALYDGVLIGHKRRNPQINEYTATADTTIYQALVIQIPSDTSNSKCGYCGVSTNKIPCAGVSGYFSATNYEYVYFTFARNDYDECVLKFYNQNTEKNYYVIFAEALDGNIKVISRNMPLSTSDINYWCPPTTSSGSSLNANVFLCDVSDDKKYLVPCVVGNVAFKRVYYSINKPQDPLVIYELGGKKYVETSFYSSGSINYAGLAMLYDEGA